jgi:hypothetical protein
MTLLVAGTVSNNSRRELNKRIQIGYVHNSNGDDSLRVPPDIPSFVQPSVNAISI